MKLILILSSLSLAIFAQAQVDREDVPSSGIQLQINTHRIIGKVTELTVNRPLAAATVQLFILKNGKSDSLIRGGFTKNNGDFSFEQLPEADSFRLVITGIGYQTKEILIDGSIKESVDLGNIALQAESKILDNIVINTSRPALEMGIDRKIFNVGKNLTASGGTALDVMRNIPSVSVDVEGNVLLRNAQPQIFVDGRPTILTPDQIPADQIERIELITNPSSRYDASSAGGIINIIMKKNKRIGLNGVATIGAGHPSVLNGNLSVNARQGKVNLFLSGNYFQQGGKANGNTQRENRQAGLPKDYFNQRTANQTIRRFGSLRFGLDFFATNRATFSITQNFVNGNSRNEEEQEQEYLNQNQQLIQTGERNATGKNKYNRSNTQLLFTQKFAEQNKELSASINYNIGNSSENADIINRLFLSNGNPVGAPAQVKNSGQNENDQYTFQIDFTDPVGEKGKFEAGLRSYFNQQNTQFNSYRIENGQEVLLPLGNHYAFRENVNAAYLSYSREVGTTSFLGGLRAEVSSFEGQLKDSAKSFGYNYPSSASRFFDALFPSVFLTKKISEDAEVQFNYSRRIRRPSFWQLNPFIDITDPVNLRQGNPQLQPEFVNFFEFNYSQDYKKGNFLGVIYYRNNMRDITRYGDTISASLYQQLNNVAINPNAILNTFINAKSTNTIGLELTLQHDFRQGFSVVPTIDMQYRKVNADVNALRLSNSGFNWDAELTLNYLFQKPKGLLQNFALQLSGEYESEEVTAQGRNAPEYQVDFGFRKEFGKEKKASLGFNINDIFNTNRQGSYLETEQFYQESFRRRNVRNFRVTFSYKFGKDDFKLFRRDTGNEDEDR